jgi:hypothetical protein
VVINCSAVGAFDGEHTAWPFSQVHAIIVAAGESDDRRFVPRERDGREESPDSDRCDLAGDGSDRATRLVTPGGRAS